MKNKLIFVASVLVVATILLPPALFAENITLDKALEMALQNNPDLRTQELSLQTAKRNYMNVWNKFLPSLNATGSYANAHDFATSSEWNWGASAGATLSFSFALPSSIEQVKLNYENEKLNYENLLAQTKSNVSTSFYSLIAEQQNLEILLDSQKLAKEVYEQTLRNYNSGLASELDMLNSRYSYLSIEPQIQQARSTYKANLANFGLTIGLDDVSDLVLQGELKSPELKTVDSEKIINQFLENRYDVQCADISVKLAKIAKQTALSGYMLPSLNFSENLSLSQAKMDAISNGADTSPVSGNFSVSVSVPLSSLIPGSSEYLSVRSNDDSIKKANISAEETRKSAKNDIATKFSDLERLWNSLEIAKLNESISKRSYELSQEGYNAGLVSQTDLESSRQKYVSAQQSVLQSQISYLSANYSAAQSVNISIEQFYSTFEVLAENNNAQDISSNEN